MTTEPRALILCVDDDPNVLEGLSLHLRRRYDVCTATSGAAGLEALAQQPTPVVIISDMQMPGMNGATFLLRARQEVPEAIRILLTGQADTNAAISAVNDGQVFRFLCKPCQPPTLLAAVEAALEQHRLVTAERVLLQQTLRGSIKALMEVLALTSPAAFGRANRIRQHVTDATAALEFDETWQIEMAAMLSQLGSIILPPNTLSRLHAGEALSEAEYAMVTRMPVVTEQLLASIPRLEVVRGILSTYYRSPAIAPTNRNVASGDATLIVRGAGVLRVAIDFDALETRGQSAADAIGIMRSRAGYDAAALNALTSVVADRVSRHGIREVPLSALRVGMVLAADVKNEGVLLAARGYEVTPRFIERLANTPEAIKARLLIVVPLERGEPDATSPDVGPTAAAT